MVRQLKKQKSVYYNAEDDNNNVFFNAKEDSFDIEEYISNLGVKKRPNPKIVRNLTKVLSNSALKNAIVVILTSLNLPHLAQGADMVAETAKQDPAFVNKILSFVSSNFAWVFEVCGDATETLKGLSGTARVGAHGAKEATKTATETIRILLERVANLPDFLGDVVKNYVILAFWVIVLAGVVIYATGVHRAHVVRAKGNANGKRIEAYGKACAHVTRAKMDGMKDFVKELKTIAPQLDAKAMTDMARLFMTADEGMQMHLAPN